MPRSSSLALAREVDDLRRQFEQISADADALVTPLSDHQFNWRPASEAWSVAECVEHLNVTARMYLPKLDEAIADAISRGRYGEGPFRYSWLGRWFVRIQEPPAKIRVRAPKAFQPGPTRSRSEIMAAFRAYQVQYIDRLRQANGLDLARAYVSSPAGAWIRFSLGSGFDLMAAHERRHLWQARNVTQHAQFPR
jgi:hypothetical protein